MTKCPVCNFEFHGTRPSICPYCQWDFDLPIYDPEEYQERLESSRKKWNERPKKPEDSIFIEPITGMEFVYIRGDNFRFGFVPGNEIKQNNPDYEVRLKDFYMAIHPVTQGQWKKIDSMVKKSSNKKKIDSFPKINNVLNMLSPPFVKKGDKYPVVNISWKDATNFINKLNRLNENNYSFDLPTEENWEFAARSGGKEERYAGDNNIKSVAWYRDNSSGSIQPVCRKCSNGLGLYDMSGNVWEWCKDSFESSSKDRVVRGGSWFDDERLCQTTYRGSFGEGSKNDRQGFRVLRYL